jgi:hypothetical protein
MPEGLVAGFEMVDDSFDWCDFYPVEDLGNAALLYREVVGDDLNARGS